jgi:hypothetical protein
MSNPTPPEPPTPRADRLARVQRRGSALRRRRRLTTAAAGLAATAVLVGVTSQLTLERGRLDVVAADQSGSVPQTSATPSPARPGDVVPSDPADAPAPARPGDVVPPAPGRVPPPAGQDCPPDVTEPTMTNGGYCGPEPQAGNGLGPDGVCTGRETAPPCGPGVEPGRWYPYTLALSCDAHTIFNGQRWLSTLGPPPAEQTPRPVWIRLDSPEHAGVLSPTTAGGYRLDPDGPATSCAPTPTPRTNNGSLPSAPEHAPAPR